MLRYVWRDLVRNPRRTLASLVGVALGVGLFSGVLFFIDGSGATMTKRAIAPLALDMQVVLTVAARRRAAVRGAAVGRAPGRCGAGQEATFTLTVVNAGAVPANEVVVNDEPPPPLSYVHGSTTARTAGRLPDAGRAEPARPGARAAPASTSGRSRPGETVTLTYAARATRAVRDGGALRAAGPDLEPRERRADAGERPGAADARAAAARGSRRIPGVAAADGLSFVDLPPGSLQRRGRDRRRPGAGLRVRRALPAPLPVDPARRRIVRTGSGAAERGGGAPPRAAARRDGRAERAGRRRRRWRCRSAASPTSRGPSRSSPAASRASSRTSSTCRDSVVVSPPPSSARHSRRSARASAAQRTVVKSLPVSEVDVLVDRSRLHADPARALAQTQAIARVDRPVAPGQHYLIDNISNTLGVARRRRRRRQADVPLPRPARRPPGRLPRRVRGRHPRRRAAPRTGQPAHPRGASRPPAAHARRTGRWRSPASGSLLGAGLGFLSATGDPGAERAAVGRRRQTSPRRRSSRSRSACSPRRSRCTFPAGDRSVARSAAQRREMAVTPVPAWRRRRLDLALLVAAAVARRASRCAPGASTPPSASVSAGESVSLPSRLLLAPLVAWFGGVLLAVRDLAGARVAAPAARLRRLRLAGARARSPAACDAARGRWPPGSSASVWSSPSGSRWRCSPHATTTRRPPTPRFVVGSDLRVTPSVLSPRPHPPGYASRARGRRASSAVTPVVSKLENSVLIGPYDQDRPGPDRDRPGRLRARGRAVRLVLRRRLGVGGDGGARGRIPTGCSSTSRRPTTSRSSPATASRCCSRAERSTRRSRRSASSASSTRSPGSPRARTSSRTSAYYAAATRSRRRPTSSSPEPPTAATRASPRAAAALRAGPGRTDPIDIESRATALNKDQSSLTALNVQGLVDLDSLYTLLMSAAVIAIFVFGLMLQRRREYVTLRAQGMRGRRAARARARRGGRRRGRAGCSPGCWSAPGTAALLVHVLRAAVHPRRRGSPPGADVALLAVLPLAATLASALVATGMLRRLRPTELLREG